MSFETFGQPLLTFPDAEKSPLSIRAKALVFVDPRSRQLRQELEQLAPRDDLGVDPRRNRQRQRTAGAAHPSRQ
jgi:hypothetical protein